MSLDKSKRRDLENQNRDAYRPVNPLGGVDKKALAEFADDGFPWGEVPSLLARAVALVVLSPFVLLGVVIGTVTGWAAWMHAEASRREPGHTPKSRKKRD